MTVPLKYAPFSLQPTNYEEFELLHGLFLVLAVLFVGWAIVSLWKLFWRFYERDQSRRK